MNNVLHRAAQIFKKLLLFNGSVLLAMSLQRLVLFLLVVRHWLFGTSGAVIGQVFFTGVRFDLCVLGFLNIPVLWIVWAICTDRLIRSENPLVQSVRKWILWFYLGLATLLVHLMGLFDLFFFANTGHRWTYEDWQTQGFDFVMKTITRWGWLFSVGVIAVFLLLWVFRCLSALYKVQLHTGPMGDDERVSPVLLWLTGALLPIVVVASAARGTWTAHHLAFEHAQVSQIGPLNQLALSPLWAFDKKF